MTAALDSAYSSDFMIVGSKLSVRNAIALARKTRPEYLVVTRMKRGKHDHYTILTEALLEAAQSQLSTLDLEHFSLERFLDLPKHRSARRLKVPGNPLVDQEARQMVTIELPFGDPIIVELKNQAIGIVDPLRNDPTAIYRFRGHEYQRATPQPSGKPPLLPSLELGQDLQANETSSLPAQLEIEAEEITLERYPYSSFPEKATLGQTVTLEIIVKLEPLDPALDPLKLKLRPGEKEVTITAVINPGTFRLLGPDTANILVPAKPENSQPITFSLEAKQKGWQKVSVDFLQQSTFLGRIESKSLIVSSPLEAGSPHPRITRADWKLEEQRLDPPDLTLLIIEKRTNGGFEYEIRVQSEKLDVPFDKVGRIEFRGDPETEFRAMFQDIENLGVSSEVAEENVAAKGKKLYNRLFPSELQIRYWDLHKRIESVQVISDEPWIPWEIIKPWRTRNGKGEEDKFLCENYAFSRWLGNVGVKRKKELTRMKLVVPSDTTVPNARQESDWLVKLGKTEGFDVSIESSHEQVMTCLRKGGFDVLHFCTHGDYQPAYPDQSPLLLEKGEELRPENVTGIATNFGQEHPLVVLNACRTGAQGFSLTGLGGWASAFLEAGASAFIGTLWSVSNETALAFTKQLYSRLAKGIPLGQAVRDSRYESKRKGDPSWLAYQLYAQPNSPCRLGKNN